MLKIVFLTLLFFFSSFTFISANLALPDPPCTPWEEFFEKDKIDASNFEKIRKLTPERDCLGGGPCKVDLSKNFDGYCVDFREYCSKVECGLSLKIKIFDRILEDIYLYPNAVAILINFIIDSSLVFIIFFFSDLKLSKFFKFGNLVKVIFITFWGYLSDYIGYAISFITMLYVAANLDFGEYDIKIKIAQMFLFHLIIYVLVYMMFYSLFAKRLFIEKKKRIIFTAIYAFISNPIWLLIYRFI